MQSPMSHFLVNIHCGRNPKQRGRVTRPLTYTARPRHRAFETFYTKLGQWLDNRLHLEFSVVRHTKHECKWKVPCYFLDTVGQMCSIGATLAMLKERGQFLESSPAVHFIPSALPGGHALAQASIPDDGTSKKVSLYCSVGSLQDVHGHWV